MQEDKNVVAAIEAEQQAAAKWKLEAIKRWAESYALKLAPGINCPVNAPGVFFIKLALKPVPWVWQACSDDSGSACRGASASY